MVRVRLEDLSDQERRILDLRPEHVGDIMVAELVLFAVRGGGSGPAHARLRTVGIKTFFENPGAFLQLAQEAWAEAFPGWMHRFYDDRVEHYQQYDRKKKRQVWKSKIVKGHQGPPTAEEEKLRANPKGEYLLGDDLTFLALHAGLHKVVRTSRLRLGWTRRMRLEAPEGRATLGGAVLDDVIHELEIGEKQAFFTLVPHLEHVRAVLGQCREEAIRETSDRKPYDAAVWILARAYALSEPGLRMRIHRTRVKEQEEDKLRPMNIGIADIERADSLAHARESALNALLLALEPLYGLVRGIAWSDPDCVALFIPMILDARGDAEHSIACALMGVAVGIAQGLVDDFAYSAELFSAMTADYEGAQLRPRVGDAPFNQVETQGMFLGPLLTHGPPELDPFGKNNLLIEARRGPSGPHAGEPPRFLLGGKRRNVKRKSVASRGKGTEIMIKAMKRAREDPGFPE